MKPLVLLLQLFGLLIGYRNGIIFDIAMQNLQVRGIHAHAFQNSCQPAVRTLSSITCIDSSESQMD